MKILLKISDLIGITVTSASSILLCNSVLIGIKKTDLNNIDLNIVIYIINNKNVSNENANNLFKKYKQNIRTNTKSINKQSYKLVN